jgi:hypothetical protein
MAHTGLKMLIIAVAPAVMAALGGHLRFCEAQWKGWPAQARP